MKVAIVAESFLPQVNGVTNSVLRVLDYLRCEGHDARIIAPRASKMPSSVNGYPVHGLPSLGLPGYQAVRVSTAPSFSIERILEDFDPDVVHIAAPMMLGYRALLATARMGLPSVAIYQTEVPTYVRRYGMPQAEPILWRRIRDIHSLATLTVAPSSFSRSQLRQHDIPRVHIWGRGVDSARFRPEMRSEAFRRSVAPGGEKIIGYVGRLAYEKQVGDLAAVADLPGTKLVIVGGGPIRAELESLLPKAVFLGQLSGDDLATAYASFDVFVTPGELETFCQTIQESMASGVPVVAPRRGGPIDLVDVSRTGWLYDPGDLAAMRSHVADLLGDDRKRQAFSTKARAQVENRTWHNVCAQLEGYYRQAMAVADARIA